MGVAILFSPIDKAATTPTLMTLSKENRLQNMEQALRLMLGRLGDRAMYKEFFNPEDPIFTEVYPTSWKELEDRGLVRAHRTYTSVSYELRGTGWFCAMGIDDLFDTPAFEERFGKLSAAIKNHVRGRHEKQITSVGQLVEETGLAEDWIYNIIKAKVWKHQYNRVGAEYDSDDVIWIPIDFNMPPLD